MQIQDRFLKYVSVNTQSDPNTDQFPSTSTQIAFADMLAEEMRELGITQVERDENGYVYGMIPPSRIQTRTISVSLFLPTWTPHQMLPAKISKLAPWLPTTEKTLS